MLTLWLQTRVFLFNLCAVCQLIHYDGETAYER